MSHLPARFASADNGWFDKVDNHYDEIDFKKKKGAKNLLGQEFEQIVPSAGEVRLLGNRHK